MAYVLNVAGLATNVATGEEIQNLRFPQVEFKTAPQQIAAVLKAFAGNPAKRSQLPSWDERRIN